MAEPRDRAQRIADTLVLLTREIDCWVASASAAGDAHLVPLSFVWDGARLVLATALDTPTTRNLQRAGWARLALGSTRDVVLVDGAVEIIERTSIDPRLADAFAGAAAWEPRHEPNDHVYLLLTPRRVLAWREANEIPGRTIMRDGRWLDGPTVH
ncbi:MAG: pyridoxamine 5'-phosphate oxidase family protein [Chloroflexi bacterium]|nr:pyridoxamine 5'-phosphate oxidase family protein [Chloroflexota bacterium]